MINSELYQATLSFLEQEMPKEGSHDVFHCIRVYNTASLLSRLTTERFNPTIVGLGALLHVLEIPNSTATLQTTAKCAQNEIDGVLFIHQHISFHTEISSTASDLSTSPFYLDLCIAQDADRLDSIGSIGIARAFAFGGLKERALFDGQTTAFSSPGRSLPNSELSSFLDSLRNPADVEALLGEPRKSSSDGTTIQHFFDKLLHLASLMKTAAGKKIARRRHAKMVDFLKSFLDEWNGIDDPI
ncbi:putative metal dependent phosphohydrolase [Blattamonas nauphoetae]|uniref:Metal dependent phosphohydrolase n=1 Tax=Blattamonas nauphoetae TaxID=2049346 RepID=A0ABQ9YB32_9EUKA|nr:putative metal dependent phosphohydrolase [Blattamonas nauphoetae]